MFTNELTLVPPGTCSRLVSWHGKKFRRWKKRHEHFVLCRQLLAANVLVLVTNNASEKQTHINRQCHEEVDNEPFNAVI